jgi:hypothetical protein
MQHKQLKENIEILFGNKIRYAKDCDNLAQIISSKTRHRISGSTLKRFFKITPGHFEPRLYTLDILSKYLGYSDYDEFLINASERNFTNSENLTEINISNLKEYEIIKFEYESGSLVVAQYLLNADFRILESINSNLQVHDYVSFNQIVTNFPLVINEVKRKNECLGLCVLGAVNGIKRIEKLVKPN